MIITLSVLWIDVLCKAFVVAAFVSVMIYLAYKPIFLKDKMNFFDSL